MNRNVLKIGLDVVMVLVLVVLYDDRVVSIGFHERVGLGIFVLFLIHKGINWKWILGVSRRLVKGSVPSNTKAGYIVDVLLFVAMVYIVVSGILISRTILVQWYGTSPVWTFGHFFASAIALILVGVHVGLHWSFVRNMFSRLVRLPRAVARPLGIACLLAVVCFGIYSLVTSSFLYWLVGPLILTGHLSAERAFSLFGGAGLTGSASKVVATYGSIVAVVAVETVLIESALARGRR